MNLSKAASALGKKGGQIGGAKGGASKSPEKQAASRANGQLGGRLPEGLTISTYGDGMHTAYVVLKHSGRNSCYGVSRTFGTRAEAVLWGRSRIEEAKAGKETK